MIRCPGCNEGWVLTFEIPERRSLIFVCEECETTWLSKEGIGIEHPTNFVNYMRSLGLRGEWTELIHRSDLDGHVI